MEQMKRFADNQLIIGDRFKITYYSTSDGEEITRIGRWDEKSTLRTSKAGDKLMIYYDEEKQGYRTAKNEWKLEAAEIIKNEKATKNLEEDKKMSENTEMSKMSVKALKAELRRLRISYSGIIEKSELIVLVEKARKLKDYDQRNAQLNTQYKAYKSNIVSPLFAASAEGNVNQVRSLLSQEDSGINQVNERGMTPLIVASFAGIGNQYDNYVQIVRLLIENGADVNKQQTNGKTALSLASQNGHLEIVRTILNLGDDVDVNLSTKSGWTPLMLASQRGLLDIVKFLLDNGADVTRREMDYGHTAGQIAALNGQMQVVKFFSQNKNYKK